MNAACPAYLQSMLQQQPFRAGRILTAEEEPQPEKLAILKAATRHRVGGNAWQAVNKADYTRVRNILLRLLATEVTIPYYIFSLSQVMEIVSPGAGVMFISLFPARINQ